MTTAQLRAALKAIDSEITVHRAASETVWTVRTSYNLTQVREALQAMGLVEVDSDVEGSRWDWRHVLYVEEPGEDEDAGIGGFVFRTRGWRQR